MLGGRIQDILWGWLKARQLGGLVWGQNFKMQFSDIMGMLVKARQLGGLGADATLGLMGGSP